MAMNWKTRLRHYYGDYRLTISGDISFAPKQALRYTWSAAVRKKLDAWKDSLQQRYPFFKISMKEGIRECEIEFFAFSSACADSEFLEIFCQHLREIALITREDPQVHLTMNFSGVFSAYKEAKHFRILNKKDDVQYQITECKKRTPFDWMMRSSYARIGLTILLILAIMQFVWSELAPAEVIGKVV